MSDTSGLNLNNINVDESGRVSFSGLRSGIDIEGTVDAIIQARRIPVYRLETRVAVNQEKLTALDELESVVNVLRDRLSVLRGAVSFNNANNIFAAKNAFASASRIDSGSASPVAEIMGISVDNSAALGSSTIEVLQIAKAPKLGSGDFSSRTSDLQTATGAAGAGRRPCGLGSTAGAPPPPAAPPPPNSATTPEPASFAGVAAERPGAGAAQGARSRSTP